MLTFLLSLKHLVKLVRVYSFVGSLLDFFYPWI